jgi:hypothetical protein
VSRGSHPACDYYQRMTGPRGRGRLYQAGSVTLKLAGWHDVPPGQASKLSLREATMAIIKPQGTVARATAPVRRPRLIVVGF